MRLTIKQVVDYCHCPMYYKFKYEHPDLKTETINVLEKYDSDIHKTVYSFFGSIQNFEEPSLGALKRAFGKLWIGNRSAGQMLYSEPTSWRDTHNERRKRGINTLVGIYDNFKDNPGFPVVVNKEYQIQIHEDLTLTGTWEVIREVEIKGTKEIQIIDFKVQDKIHNRIHVDKDLEISAASLAFQEAFEMKEDRILYYGLEKNKVHNTSRGERDHEVLKHTVTSVAKAIDQRLFYAAPGDKCYSCMYKGVCSNSLTVNTMI